MALENRNLPLNDMISIRIEFEETLNLIYNRSKQN